MINIGIGFATGRKIFSVIARTYAENWNESGLINNKNVNINIFVAYDLNYKNTRPEDYRNLDSRTLEMLDYPFFICNATAKREMAMLVSSGVISRYEAALLFGDGYAKKRNAIMYFAIKNGMDYLLYLDDDEYPLAAIKNPDGISWRGQQVLSTHLESIGEADITLGHHCGYVSPIPSLDFDERLNEKDFQLLIETLSNDIINWDSIREKMRDGGVTYADRDTISSRRISEVAEKDGVKFISGSNLLINLKTDKTLFPFYNPPGARGEDTFFGTCLSEHKVLKVPCYTFHDGFASYPHLLRGTLPQFLKPVKAGNAETDERFLNACIGWIRYKPLLLYITRRSDYEASVKQMRRNLGLLIPKLCDYFGNSGFARLYDELEYYSENVVCHYKMFEDTKAAWKKVVDYLGSRDGSPLSETMYR